MDIQKSELKKQKKPFIHEEKENGYTNTYIHLSNNRIFRIVECPDKTLYIVEHVEKAPEEYEICLRWVEQRRNT